MLPESCALIFLEVSLTSPPSPPSSTSVVHDWPGIIDILQYYNARKMGETVMRKAAGNSGEDISCVDPETYGKRFVKFIANLVEE